MSAVVLVFALNLFGVFEISLPQSATSSLMDVTAREGDAGAFFQGIFATILATPCTAPYLGTALGFAFTQSSAMILLIFIAIAAGMSAPYLLLSRATGMAAFSAEARPMDGAREAADGISPARDVALSCSRSSAPSAASSAVIWASAFLLVLSLVCWMKGQFLLPTTYARHASDRACAHARARNR